MICQALNFMSVIQLNSYYKSVNYARSFHFQSRPNKHEKHSHGLLDDSGRTGIHSVLFCSKSEAFSFVTFASPPTSKP
jgi:hypothetical protein